MFWQNMLELDNTIWHICFACRITKATNTHSVYVILIAFPLQQWLHECASMLRYKDMSCLVCILCIYTGCELQPVSDRIAVLMYYTLCERITKLHISSVIGRQAARWEHFYTKTKRTVYKHF